MNAFNRVERQRYWIDGVKPMTSLIWYALAYDFDWAIWAIKELLRVLPGTVFAALADAEDPHAGLVEHLNDPELSANYQADAEFRAQFNAEVARLLSPPAPAGTTADALPVPAADPVANGDRIRAQVRSSLYNEAARRAAAEGAGVVVFGHTHDPGSEALPDGATYVNSGTWTWSGDFTAAGKETWRDLFEHPERYTNDRRLVYVRVDYDDAGRPQGSLIVYRPQQPIPGPQPPVAGLLQRIIAWLCGVLQTLFGGNR